MKILSPGKKLLESNVSVMSVCRGIGSEGASNVTITHGALDLTVQGPPDSNPASPGHQTWDPLAPAPF